MWEGALRAIRPARAKDGDGPSRFRNAGMESVALSRVAAGPGCSEPRDPWRRNDATAGRESECGGSHGPQERTTEHQRRIAEPDGQLQGPRHGRRDFKGKGIEYRGGRTR